MREMLQYPLPEPLEKWIEAPDPMRCASSARVTNRMVGARFHYISIRHAVLKHVTARMVSQWFRYFCYQRLVDSRGESLPAFRLWHQLESRECYGRLWPMSTETRVLKCDDYGFHASFSVFGDIHGLQLEDFSESRDGVAVSTRLLLEARRLNRRGRADHDHRRMDEIKQALIRHKIEEIGNLETILPWTDRLQQTSWL